MMKKLSKALRGFLDRVLEKPFPRKKSKVKVGDTIPSLGGMEWYVLRVVDGMRFATPRALIITKDIVRADPYNTKQDNAVPVINGGKQANVTWEHSSLRAYLNGNFFNTNFQEEKGEQKLIAVTPVPNYPNPKHGKGAQCGTEDRIFLLDDEEARKYFSKEEKKNRIAKPSEEMLKHENNCKSWWLRTPGKSPETALVVDEHGDIDFAGVYAGLTHGVRPVLWRKLPDMLEASAPPSGSN